MTVVPNDRGDDTPSAILLSGFQLIRKFNRPSPDEVQIFMALFRVEGHQIDIVVTFNVPTRAEDGGAVDPGGLTSTSEDFQTLARSLQIVDFGLFA